MRHERRLEDEHTERPAEPGHAGDHEQRRCPARGAARARARGNRRPLCERQREGAGGQDRQAEEEGGHLTQGEGQGGERGGQGHCVGHANARRPRAPHALSSAARRASTWAGVEALDLTQVGGDGRPGLPRVSLVDEEHVNRDAHRSHTAQEGLARLVPLEHHRDHGGQALEPLEERRPDRLEGRSRRGLEAGQHVEDVVEVPQAAAGAHLVEVGPGREDVDDLLAAG